jgi:hypothetical protein
MLGGVAAAIAVVAGPASAAFVTPTQNPFTVPGDSSGNPQPFTVTANGFSPHAQVKIEQCDGTDPSSKGWSPTVNCDLGSSPSIATADDTGTVTFPANDLNLHFTPFKGESPQSFFNCLSPNDPPLNPTDGLTDFRNCQVRVATSLTTVTADQQFFTIKLPDSNNPPPDTPEVPYALILPLGAVAVGGAFFFIRKRRAIRSAS